MIVVLSGGVGAARLLRHLRGVVDSTQVTAVVNVGDDTTMHGLTICPDLDTITYTLAGESNEETGWGRREESWHVMDELATLGGESWFRLGDRDLALHLLRTQRLADGWTKSEVTAAVTAHFGISERLLPVTDDPLSTRVVTDEGTLSFQEYFVRRRTEPTVRSLQFEGSGEARPAPGVLDAIAAADRIVIAPSNPLLSIDPVLAVASVRGAVAARRDDVVAVSPLVAGVALKGPADRVMRALGMAASCVGVAHHYRDIVGTMVIDELDGDRAAEVKDLGMDVVVTTTVMADAEHARRLCKAVVG